ncbi:sodium/proline symporter PutP [Natronoglycomyces albus]|uniref:Sodium/proline symporter n=1 Tax=Natronoglycomyces albus TaxID=2811108 RepID=A0A895XPZ5_9ACTN|nr:sodium/proline symporter PutP [Natronoglycomyces albus]QSB05613.1 sodium/proline symporter PutP [Natronoglycomyces albus]
MGDISTPMLVTFIVYILFMLAIGVWVYRRTNTLSDFALGGRRLNSPVAALSAQASDMSGWLLLGLPGAIYVAGMGATWIAIGLAIGTYLNWLLVAPRLRTYTERANNSITLSSYFENRFEDPSALLRVVSAAIFLVFFTVYVSSGLVAGGLLFNQAFGVDANQAITIAVIVVVVYTFLGGFLAVSFTDAVQGTMMFIALVVTPLLAIGALGGFNALFDGLNDTFPALTGMGSEATFVEGSWVASETLGFIVIISSLAWGLGYFGQPHILMRFMGIKSAAHVPVARRIGVTWVVVTLAGACAVGLAGIVYFETPLEDPETVFIALTQDLLNPWVAGIILAGILAAVMSTADSQLLVASTAFTEDFYRRFRREPLSENHLLWVGRAAVIGVAVVAYALALQGGAVLDIVAYAWAGFGAAFGPVILLSLYWKRMTWVGALAGMVVGAATVMVWNQTDPFGWGLYEIVPGFALATLAIFVGSKFGKQTSLEWTGSYRDFVAPKVESKP